MNCGTSPPEPITDQFRKLEDQQLTENIIKKVALRFFRHYYKFRLRYEDQPVVAKYDLEGVDGIVADGFYSFKKPDGKLFTATFEATSLESKEEVTFQSEHRVLLWDGLAVTGLVMLLLAFYNYRSPLHALDNTKLGERVALLLLLGIVVFGLFCWIARNFRRYRYIYAVEQFKKYYADEQWIALGTDVFEDKNDRRLRELKRQCVYNGIGLLTVDKNLDPKIIITPSRHDIFAGKRNHVEFLSKQKALDLQKKGSLDLVQWLFGGLFPDLFKKDKSVLRYRRSFFPQMSIVTGCLALILFVFLKELENPAFQLVDKQAYKDQIAQSKSNNLEEPTTYLDDSLSKKEKKRKPSESYWDLHPEEPQASSQTASEQANTLRSANGDELTARGVSIDILYDCSRFYNFDGKKYILEVGEYLDYKMAASAVKGIRQKGVFSAALLKSCFLENAKGYLVYAGEIYNSAGEASRVMDAWATEKQLGKAAVENWKIRAIEPVVK